MGLAQSAWLHGRCDAGWTVLGWALAAFFVGEMGLRLIAHPAREFFRGVEVRAPRSKAERFSLQRISLSHDGLWNVFDLLVVAVSCGSLFAHVWPHPELLFTARLLRATRLLPLLGLTQRLGRIEAHLVVVLPAVFGFFALVTVQLGTLEERLAALQRSLEAHAEPER